MKWKTIYSNDQFCFSGKNGFVKGLLIFFLGLISFSSFCQISIDGVVRDADEESLIGVNVQVKGTTKGTSTDIEGHYRLENVEEDAVLVFSYVGYQTQEISVEGKTKIDVIMASDAELLEEVIVVGYGEQKKVNVIGSVTAISGRDVAEIPAPDLTNAISGRLPGSVIMQESGEPGKNEARILVRGRSTLGGSGMTSPLVVIDGTPTTSLNEIDHNDIESISDRKSTRL